jgi:hypothetical protein
MNTQTQEALKMAMYELEIVGLKDGDTYNACKEALERPAQEPDYWLGYGLQAYDEKPHDDATPLYLRPAPQPAQEPVGYIEPADLESVPDGDTGLWFAKQDERYSIPIYTHPAQPWQGLTADEIFDLRKDDYGVPSKYWDDYARAIEAKLKEKNNG